MLDTRCFLFTLAALILVFSATAEAQSRRQSAKKCSLVGILDSKQYLRKKQRVCLKSEKRVFDKGYVPLQGLIATASKGKRPSCKFIAAKNQSFAFPSSNLQCFKNLRLAKRKGFSEFTGINLNTVGDVITPTPTPASTGTFEATATPGIVDILPTPLPTPTGPLQTPNPQAAYYWEFSLGETTPGSGFAAQCAASMEGAADNIVVHCLHNVPNALEAHIHPAPGNNKFCVLSNPPADMLMNCPLQPEEAQAIIDGNGLLSIHLALGAENQAAAGFIRNP